jgi:hypothetical protein
MDAFSGSRITSVVSAVIAVIAVDKVTVYLRSDILWL